MKEQNWRGLMDDRKSRIQAIIRTAQLKQKFEQDRIRYQNMLTILENAEKEANSMIEEIKTALGNHRLQGEILKKNGGPKGKSRAEIYDGSEEEFVESDYEDDEDHDLPQTPEGEEHRNKGRALQQRLREAQIVMHQVKFLMGDAYHTLGNSEKESTAYEVAETIRRTVLKGWLTCCPQSIEKPCTKLVHSG
jgi:E3 ubiquitin-protein ligase SHPRH